MQINSNIRLIGRLDIKGPNLIKTVQLEGLRVVGDPQDFASRYYKAGIDELIYMDIVASLYGRNNLKEIVSYTAENIFVPLTVGGGIRSIDDVSTLLRAGADKVALNTAAIARPELISEAADRFGSQCIVVSIEAKHVGPNSWECFSDNGRERTGVDVLEWAERAQKLGAGEILLTSVDREGTKKGFEIPLVKAVSEIVSTPLIASGGMGSFDDMVSVVREGHADAVAMADILHFNRATVQEVRAAALDHGIPVRTTQ
jgi:imidazole glycerol-phosphate synthase subunit HisF